MINRWPIVLGIVLVVGLGGLLLAYVPSVRQAVTMNIITMPPKPDAEGTFAPSSQEVNENKPTETANVDTSTICQGQADPFSCYEKHYQDLVKNKGIPAAFADLKARYPKDGYVRAQCHPLTHVIGRQAALKYDTVGKAYKEGDSYCWSGYYHGVLETFVDRVGLKNLPTEINNVCSSIEGKDRYSFDYYNCVHGLGHGVMAITDDELFKSLDYCSGLTGTWEQESCASGVYMENVIVDNLNHYTKYLRPTEPLYPCTASPEKFKNTCYLMQTSYMLKVNGGDFKKTFQWCETAEEQYRATCLQSLGRDASGRSTSQVEATKATCLLGKDYFEQSNCIIGAVKDFISYFHSDVQAKKLCNAMPNKDLIELCLETTTNYYSQF